MKAMHSATLMESSYRRNVMMYHQIIPNANVFGVTHLPKPTTIKDLVTKKNFVSCNTNMSVAEPKIKMKECLLECMNLRRYFRNKNVHFDLSLSF